MAIFYDITMDNGETEKLTLNLGALMELSKKDKPLVDRYFELYKKMQVKNPDFNELEMGEFIYIAYRAAHVKEDSYMSIEDFLYGMTDNRVELANTFKSLFGRQEKKQPFQKHSGKPQDGKNQR